jgi:hypothetical protein
MRYWWWLINWLGHQRNRSLLYRSVSLSLTNRPRVSECMGLFLHVPLHAFMSWCFGMGQVEFLPGFPLCCQVCGELRCRAPHHSPCGILSVISLSLPSDLAVASPATNRPLRKTPSAASRCWATAGRRQNLSAQNPPQLTCSGLHLAARAHSGRLHHGRSLARNPVQIAHKNSVRASKKTTLMM